MRGRREFGLRRALVALATALFVSSFLLGGVPPAWAAGPTVETNQCTNHGSGSATQTCAFTGGGIVNSGDMMVCAVGDNNPGTTSISDTKSASWNSYSVAIGSSSTAFLFYALAPSSGSETVTFHDSADGQIAISCMEVTEITAVNTHSTGTGDSGSPAVSPSFSTDGIFVVGSIANQGNTPATTTTAGSGFTVLSGTSSLCVGTNAECSAMEYDAAPSGSQTVPASLSASTNWAEVGVDFYFTVAQPLTVTVANSGASGTITISGCGTTNTNSTFTANGNKKTYSGLTPSCTITLTVPADGAATRYRFSQIIMFVLLFNAMVPVVNGWHVSSVSYNANPNYSPKVIAMYNIGLWVVYATELYYIIGNRDFGP